MRGRAERCATCARDMPLTFHHLVPRALHRRTWCRRQYSREERASGIWVCRDCHGAFHAFATDSELGRRYQTLERLMEHPEIGRYCRWVSGQQGRHPVRRERR